MVRLAPMAPEEFRASLESAISRIADDNVLRGIWSANEAVGAARADFLRLLPRGQETPGFFFRNILEEGSAAPVGETWFSVDATGGRTHFWIHWIYVVPRHRRRGFARATLESLLQQAREAGADRVGLHVLADNREALALYAALGFVPTSHRMAKPLGPLEGHSPR